MTPVSRFFATRSAASEGAARPPRARAPARRKARRCMPWGEREGETNSIMARPSASNTRGPSLIVDADEDVVFPRGQHVQPAADGHEGLSDVLVTGVDLVLGQALPRGGELFPRPVTDRRQL